MDGVYEANINTPMGSINVKLALQQSGNIINGMIEIMGTKNPLSQGRINGNRCYFTGEMKNKSMSIRYNIIGELEGDILNINAKTNMGEFNLKAGKIM